MRDYSDDMEDREIENFKTLQKKKDRITSSDGISSRNRIQQLMESANGVPPIRARYRNGRKNEAKNNDSEHGKHKNGIYQIRFLVNFVKCIKFVANHIHLNICLFLQMIHTTVE